MQSVWNVNYTIISNAYFWAAIAGTCCKIIINNKSFSNLKKDKDYH